MSFNDYGRTPNVWRPSEVPYPGPLDRITSSVSHRNLEDNSRRVPLGWHLIYDSRDTEPDGFCTRSAALVTAFGDIPIPRVPLVCVMAHYAGTAVGGTQTLTIALGVQDGGTFYPLGQNFPLAVATHVSASTPSIRRAVLTSRLVPHPPPYDRLWMSETWSILHEDGVSNTGNRGGVVGRNLAVSSPGDDPLDADPVALVAKLSIAPFTPGIGSGTAALSRLRVWSCWAPTDT